MKWDRSSEHILQQQTKEKGKKKKLPGKIYLKCYNSDTIIKHILKILLPFDPKILLLRIYMKENQSCI